MSEYTGPWAVGMLAMWPATGDWARIMSVADDGGVSWIEGDPPVGDDGHDDDVSDAVPDASDGATIGALAGVVRELYGNPSLTVHRLPSFWQVRALNVHPNGRYDYSILGEDESEFAAWLAAYRAHKDPAGLTAQDIASLAPPSASPPVRDGGRESGGGR